MFVISMQGGNINGLARFQTVLAEGALLCFKEKETAVIDSNDKQRKKDLGIENVVSQKF